MAERRIRRPKAFEDFMSEICIGEKKVFSNLKDFLVFCASYGASKGVKTPFELTSEQIQLSVFKDKDIDFINILAIWDTKDPKVLIEERSNERFVIFEEYAHTGLQILYNMYSEAPDKGIKFFSDIILQQLSKNDGDPLKGILEDFGS
jgi:dnd system-associated protein 4